MPATATRAWQQTTARRERGIEEMGQESLALPLNPPVVVHDETGQQGGNRAPQTAVGNTDDHMHIGPITFEQVYLAIDSRAIVSDDVVNNRVGSAVETVSRLLGPSVDLGTKYGSKDCIPP